MKRGLVCGTVSGDEKGWLKKKERDAREKVQGKKSYY